MTDHPDSVLIVDFGSQVTQLIARRVREAGVYSEVAPFQSAEATYQRMRPKGIILSGGPASVTEATSPRAPQAFFEAGVPVLGICYGQQLMSAQLGGEVVMSGDGGEFGHAMLEVKEPCALTDGLWTPGERHQVWMSHGDKRRRKLPDGFRAGRESRPALADLGDRRRRAAQILRDAVSSRSRAHAGRRAS